MLKDLLLPEIKSLIENRDWAGLREGLADAPAPEVAELLPELDAPERVLLFRALPRRLSTEIFSHLEPEDQNSLLTALRDEETRVLLAQMPPDDRTTLLEALPDEVTRRLLNLLTPEDRKEARELLGYPEESVGRLMTPDFVAVRPEWTIAEAVEHIRRKGRDSETVNTIYVVDDNWKLLDALELRRLILASPEQTVESLMDHSFISVSATDDREEAVRTIQRYDLEAAPVVSVDGSLIGIVTVDDVLDVAEEEFTEDLQKLSAMAPLEFSYKSTGLRLLYRKRIGWLLILVMANLITIAVMKGFEDTLEAMVVLAFFIPLLMGSAGNTGAQSATLMIRSLSTGDLQLTEWLPALVKEVSVGVALGLTMATLCFILGTIYGGMGVGMVVGLTMLILVVVANLIGMMLPFLLTKMKLDPAVASSPLIMTIIDAVGLIIYFAIAVLLLNL
ncbi:MAG: magnesium transporter [Phycisphaeraceae bacterium]|nr:MAG: magnesium transporter [Phycisphaeraceae bacterium]